MRTKFPFSLWFWTRGDESLFDLDGVELATFQLLCEEAARS